jgi:hypothetical protein
MPRLLSVPAQHSLYQILKVAGILPYPLFHPSGAIFFLGNVGVKEKGERSQFDHLQCSFSFSDKDNGIGTRLSNSVPDISQKCRNGTTPAKKLTLAP